MNESSRELESLRSQLEEITGVPRADIAPDSMLVGDLDLDSLALAELLVWVVDEYGIQEGALELEKTNWQDATVQTAIDLVRSSRAS